MKVPHDSRLPWAGPPAILPLDTVPGRGRDGEASGWRIRTIAAGARQLHTDGYLLFRGADSLELGWTNFHTVGADVVLGVKGDTMAELQRRGPKP